MLTPLLYDLDIIQALRLQEQSMKEMFPGYTISKEFVDYHNHVCPRCQQEQKVFNNTVKKMGTVSAFEHPSEKKVILYVSCKNCTKELAKQSKFGSKPIKNSDIATHTEDYILEKLENDRIN